MTLRISSAGRIYRDLDPRYRVNSPEVIAEGDDALNVSIGNILGTRTGTIHNYRAFGSRFLDLLFEPMNDETAESMVVEANFAISRWEPRVQVDLTRSQVIPDFDRNYYNTSIIYLVRFSGVLGNFQDIYRRAS